MIKFENLCSDLPYFIFKEKYDEAIRLKQNNVEAVSISTFNHENQEVDSRYINLKFVNHNEFIFFTNYNSPKAKAIETHNQISALIYWDSINCQIRLKANINKTKDSFNQKYFETRDIKKNAIAICSHQSQKISDYDKVIEEYYMIKETANLKICPEYWGGFSFKPYYFEFWEGHESRINKREIFEKIDGVWKQSILQP